MMNSFVSPIAHIDFLLNCFDPIEEPLKFHCAIPPSHAVVTPANMNNMPHRDISTDLYVNSEIFHCQHHLQLDLV